METTVSAVMHLDCLDKVVQALTSKPERKEFKDPRYTAARAVRAGVVTGGDLECITAACPAAVKVGWGEPNRINRTVGRLPNGWIIFRYASLDGTLVAYLVRGEDEVVDM